MKTLSSVVLIFLLLFTGHLLYAQSSSFSVTVQVGTTNLILEGYTSPNSFVSFVENNSTIATTTSDSTGFFTTTLTSYNLTERTITISSTDTSSRTTSGTTVSITLVPGTNTTLSNIVLSPTFSVNKTTMNSTNDSIVITGRAVPNSQIQLFIDTIYNLTVTVDVNGNFSATLLPTSLSEGIHSFYIKSIVGLYESVSSISQSFTISQADESDDDDDDNNDENSSQTESPIKVPILPVYSPANNQTPSISILIPVLTDGKNIFLTERITHENISEYVELWSRYKNSGTLQCDLNNDNVCDLVDFSILMYRVGR